MAVGTYHCCNENCTYERPRKVGHQECLLWLLAGAFAAMNAAGTRRPERFAMAGDAYLGCNESCMHNRSRWICYGNRPVPLRQRVLHAQKVRKDLLWLLTRTVAVVETARRRGLERSAMAIGTYQCCNEYCAQERSNQNCNGN